MLGWRRRSAPRPALDEDFIQRLERHLGPEGTRELLADALIEIEDRLRALEAAAAAGDRDAALSHAHDLTGTAGHAGLSALSVAAAEVQRGLIERPDPPVAALAAPLPALWAEGRAALSARLGLADAGRRTP